jgi:hypothetical protein
MFLRALSFCDSIGVGIEVYLLYRSNSQEDLDAMNREIGKIPNAHLLELKTTTRGAIETCLLAEEFIKPDDAVLILDCDLWIRSNEFTRFIVSDLEAPIDGVGGALAFFNSDSPRYSYLLSDEQGFVVKTAEKKVISGRAIAGAYYISKGKDFLDSAHQVMNSELESGQEFYTSYIYNQLIRMDLKIKSFRLTEYRSFGTPEELCEVEKKNLNWK